MPTGGIKRPAANSPSVQGSPVTPVGSAQKKGRYAKSEVVGTYVPFETDNPVEQSIEEDKINLMKLVSEPQHEGFIHKYFALIKSGEALRMKAPKNSTRVGEWRPERWTTFGSIAVGWQESHLIGIDPEYTEVCNKMKSNKKGSTSDLWIWIHCVSRKTQLPDSFQDEDVFVQWCAGRRARYADRMELFKTSGLGGESGNVPLWEVLGYYRFEQDAPSSDNDGPPTTFDCVVRKDFHFDPNHKVST